MVATMPPAETAMAIPITAKVKDFLAVPILSGLPAEVRKRIPDHIIIIVAKDPISMATFERMLVSSLQKLSVPPSGFTILTWANAGLAIKSKLEKTNKLIRYFLMFIL